MPNRKIKIDDTKDPVYTWSFESSKPRGGRIIHYQVRLETDGTLNCNCPGWAFKRAGKPRSCKHLKAVASEVKVIMKKFKAGEDLPILEAIGEDRTGAGGALSSTAGAQSRIQHGRVIEI